MSMRIKYVLVCVIALSGLCAAMNSAIAQTWSQTSAPITNWTSVACSADGTKLAAVAGGDFDRGGIYTSMDSGVTWALSAAPDGHWQANDDFPTVIIHQPQSQTAPSGSNVIFRVDADGSRSLLYQWRVNGVEIPGATNATLMVSNVQAAQAGSSYTVLVSGKFGSLLSETVFLSIRNWPAYSRLTSFDFPDLMGAHPLAPLIQARDGLLYGTTSSGGASNQGTIFSLNADGSAFKVIHSFGADAKDGQNPYAGLLEANDEMLYGTTAYGGSNNQGIVFRLSKGGAEYAILHTFGSPDGDGGIPYAELHEGKDGALYGATSAGGPYDYYGPDDTVFTLNYGTVFKLNKYGSNYVVLHNFNCDEGAKSI